VRRIFGANSEEEAEDWRRLHHEELQNLYASLYIIRVIKSKWIRWAIHVVRMEEMRNSYTILVGKPEEKRSLGRPRLREEDNIKMDLHEISCDRGKWI